MNPGRIVNDEQWLDARKKLLIAEKAYSKQREELTRLRQQMPWRRIEKEYEFDSTQGKRRLLDLFGPHSQLLVYHFMYGPDWEEGCKICSLLADHYDPLIVHLKARDVALVTVSRAPIEVLAAYRKRMKWRFEWVSSLNTEFNRDFGVSFTQEEMDAGQMNYNYKLQKFPSTECPGVSCFARNEAGEVFHTYSAYDRGLENLLGVYSFLDLVPKGRDESQLPYGMAWVRHHDRYGDDSFVEPYA